MLQIKVNNKEFSVAIEEDVHQGVIGGKLLGCKIEEIGKGRFLVRNKDKAVEIFLLSASEDGKELEVQVAQSYFKIAIQSELDQLMSTMGFKSTDSKKMKELKSPMPGKIVSVLVEEGSELKVGDPLLVLEAMKMENVLQCSLDGKVGKIMVEKGASVNKNDILIKFV